jgi:type II secretory pathway component PulF
MLVMAVLALLVPKFESAFVDFKLKLPIVTVALIAMSQACRELYLWAILLPVPAIWAVANFNVPDKHRRRRIRLWAFIAVAAFLIFTLLALFFPLLGLVNGTSAGAVHK